jgi:transcriptional regulator with XRE-family HTH domain
MKWVSSPIWVKIGRNIKNCRKWKGLTPEQVAFKAKIELKRYKRMERAIVRDITHDETLRIAQALNLGNDDEMIVCH